MNHVNDDVTVDSRLTGTTPPRVPAGADFTVGVAQSFHRAANRDFPFPILYREGCQITGLFAAKLWKLRDLMPDARYVPARLAPGVGVIAVTCFEYLDTDLGPYNELAIGVVLDRPAKARVFPGMAMLTQLLDGQFNVWVHHLPVTTELARAVGKDYYNYPKYVADIDYCESADTRTCRLSEKGTEILTMHCDKISGKKTQDITLLCNLYQNRLPQLGEFGLRVEKFGRSIRPGAAKLEISSDHPQGRELADLLISTSSLGAAYSPRIQGVLQGPSYLTPEVVSRLNGDLPHISGSEV